MAWFKDHVTDVKKLPESMLGKILRNRTMAEESL